MEKKVELKRYYKGVYGVRVYKGKKWLVVYSDENLANCFVIARAFETVGYEFSGRIE